MTAPRFSFRSSSLVGLAIATAASLMWSGCHSVHSLSAEAAQQKGIPYHLPAGSVTLTLTFTESGDGDAKKVTPTFAPQTANYPDPGSTFYLRPDNNGFFGTHHTISVSNGLLTSVSTDETGQIKEAILAIADTGINLAKLKYGIAGLRAQGGAAPVDIFLNDDRYPTDAEIAFVLSRASGSSVAVNLRPESPPGASGLTKEVAGAGPFLEVHSSLVESSLKPAEPPAGVVLVASPDKDGFGGIYTRSLRPYLAGAELVLKLDELRKLRLRSYVTDRDNMKLTLAHANADTDLDRAELKRQNDELTANEDLIKRLRAQDANIIVELSKPEVTGTARTANETLRTSVEQSLTTAKSASDTLRTSIAALQTRIHAADEQSGLKTNQLAKDEAMIVHYSNNDDPSYLPGHSFALRSVVTLVALPDPTSIAGVEITRAPIGQTTNTLTLADGILTKYESNRPSSFNEIAKIPLEVTNKLVAAVAQIFQFRIDTNTQRYNAKSSDVDLAEKLYALDKRMTQLEKTKQDDAKAAANNAGSSTTSGASGGTSTTGSSTGPNTTSGSNGSQTGNSTSSGSQTGGSTSTPATTTTSTRPGEEGLSPDGGKSA